MNRNFKDILWLILGIVLIIMSIPFIAIGAVVSFIEHIISIAKEEFRRAKL